MSSPMVADESVELGLLQPAPDQQPPRAAPLSATAQARRLAVGLTLGSALAGAVLAERGVLRVGGGAASGGVRSMVSLVAAGCTIPQPGDKCFEDVTWAMSTGINNNPEWYEGLSADSSFEDFQRDLAIKDLSDCTVPCADIDSELGQASPAAEAFQAQAAVPVQAAAPAGAAAPADGACLCLFDVDRTLTVKQGSSDQCPGSEEHPGVQDNAYGLGDLVLSAVGKGVEQTFCGQCERGIISMGDVGGPPEKEVMKAHITDEPVEWGTPGNTVSTMVHGCPDPEKAKCGKDIVDWLASNKGIQIAPENVYFFDDHTGNTNGWSEYGFNAQQVSCASRDHSMGNTIGFCGAQLDEIQRRQGIFNCDQ